MTDAPPTAITVSTMKEAEKFLESLKLQASPETREELGRMEEEYLATVESNPLNK